MAEEKKNEEMEKKEPSGIPPEGNKEAAGDQGKDQQQPNNQGQSNQPQGEEKQEDPNWRAFREARKRDRLEKEAAEKRAREKEEEAAALRAAMDAAFHKGGARGGTHQNLESYTNYGGPIEEIEESDEQRIERMVTQAIEKRQKEYEQEMAVREKERMPQALRETYGDFGDVVNEDNLDYLEYHFPEIAKPLGRLPDSYEKWSDIYKAVKRFVPNAENAKYEGARADANQNKPRSISSTQVTGTEVGSTSAARLTQERRAENWRRMQRVLKGLE